MRPEARPAGSSAGGAERAEARARASRGVGAAAAALDASSAREARTAKSAAGHGATLWRRRPRFATWSHRRFCRGDTLGRLRMAELKTRTHLLEREAELEQIGGALRAAAAGAGGVVVIEGAPGIGKSSLMGEAAELADGGGDGRAARARRRDGARVRARRGDRAAGAEHRAAAERERERPSPAPRAWRARCSRRCPTARPRTIACSRASTACTGCARGWPRSGRSRCWSTTRTGPTSSRCASSPTWRRGSRRSRRARSSRCGRARPRRRRRP